MRLLVHALRVVAIPFMFAGQLSAQSQTSPPGTVRGLFGGDSPQGATRTTHQVSTWFDVGAGFDKSVVGTDELPGSRDYTTTGTFRYRVGRTSRFLETQARIYQTSSQFVDSALGSEVVATGTLGAGQRTGATAFFRVANESAQLYGAFSPGAPTPSMPDDSIPPVTDVSPPTGIVEDRWLSLGGSASVFRRWTSRQRTQGAYQLTSLRPRFDGAIRSDATAVSIRHDWEPSLRNVFSLAYRFEAISQESAGLPTEPIRLQFIQAGYRRAFRPSPIRTLTVEAFGGIAQVQSSGTPLSGAGDHLQPAIDLRATYSLARRWSMAAGVGTGMTGLSAVSADAFNTDYASVSLSGGFSRRLSVVVGGTYSRGAAAGVAPGTFVASTGTATLQYGFRYGGVFAGLTRYRHELEGIRNPAGVIPSLVNRYSIRTGITLWLPLFGAF